MQPNIESKEYPPLNDKPTQQGFPQLYPQQQYPPNYPQQQVAMGYPIQGQQPYINGPSMILQPVIITPLRTNADGCSYPADIQCPYCLKPVQTYVHHKNGCQTWLACLLLFLFFLPLFFLPFCFEDCKDRIHVCPNCGKKVGKKKYKLCC